KSKLENKDFLADVQLNEPVNYPSVTIDVDRKRAAQLGLSMEEISSVLTTATSSSRFVNKNMWVDPNSGLVFQLQMQLTESDINSLDDLKSLPLKSGKHSPILDDVADLKMTSEPGQVNRKGPNRYVTVTANTEGID